MLDFLESSQGLQNLTRRSGEKIDFQLGVEGRIQKFMDQERQNDALDGTRFGEVVDEVARFKASI